MSLEILTKEEIMKLPDFGIHGCKYEEIKAKLEAHPDYIPGHYFLCGAKEKRTTPEKFMKALKATTDIALGFSYYGTGGFNLDFRNSKASFKKKPAILLCIKKEGCRANEKLKKSNWKSTAFNSYTFPSDHDAFKEDYHIIPIIFEQQPIELPNQLCVAGAVYGNIIGATAYTQKKLINIMTENILKELKKYETKQ